MHASIALDEGIDLLLCLNPLVPFDATAPKATKVMREGLPPEKHHIPRIVDGGLPAVLSQTFRTMMHSSLVLRSRKAGLSSILWRHGITLHHAALDDLSQVLHSAAHQEQP